MPECRSCKAPILWVVNVKTERMMPVDAAPVAGGNVLVTRSPKAGVPHSAAVLTREEAAREEHAGKLHLSHFATCPNAKKHRKTEGDDNRAA